MVRTRKKRLKIASRSENMESLPFNSRSGVQFPASPFRVTVLSGAHLTLTCLMEI